MIGARLSADLLAQLEACCLTDEEMALSPAGWQSLDDPFPAWRITGDGAGESLGDSVET